MNQLKQIHGYTLRNGTDFTKYLITRSLEIPNISYAHKLFDNITEPNAFLFNKLIQANLSNGDYHRCFSLSIRMLREGCSPDPHSFTFLFAACPNFSSPSQGQMLHGQFIKWGFGFDIYASTALVDMYAKMGLLKFARKQFNEMKLKDVPTWNSLIAGYAKSGDMETAMELFLVMPYRNVISWTAMISGYSQNGKYGNALEMYKKMEEEEKGLIRPNEVTIASVLPACANLGALEMGQKIEVYAKANGYFRNMFVVNAVLEMYTRCGRIDTAMQLLREIGPRRNICSWNTMIMGLAVHGRCLEALDLFDEMQREGVAPDDVTFVGAILACTHSGMVEKGQELFYLMEQRYSIAHRLEHYGCMVDLLGRAGRLKEVYNLIQNMPMKPDSVIWGTLLGACSFHGNVKFGEKAAECLFELEPWNPGNYVILSNIYAAAGRWDGVAEMRVLMKDTQITKAAGYSFIEEGGKIHKFIVEDKSHPRSDEIYPILDELTGRMKLNHGRDSTGLLVEETM